jgi:AcrR family transcriptional regulator
MRDDKWQQHLKRLEEQRRRAHERLERQQQRVNERFDRAQERLEKSMSQHQERIVDAALQLLDREGLNSLSLRKLAAQLDMQAPGLYWHFKNKGTLVDYMAEAVLREEFDNLEPRKDDESWQDWLTTTMNRLRHAMLKHTDGARVVAGAHIYPAVTLGKVFEVAAESLQSAGFDLLATRSLMITAITYTFGYVIEEQSSPSPDDLKGVDLDNFLSNFPATAAAIKAAQKAHKTDDDDYNAGLQLIVAGASRR